MSRSAGRPARNSSSGKREAARWRSSGRPRAAVPPGRLAAAARRLAVLRGRLPAGLLALAALLAGPRGPAEEPLTGEFRRAVRLLEDDAPERRAEGERLIRGMGQRAVPQLRAWVLRSEGELDRARALLAELGGPSEQVYNPLAAARPFLSRSLAGAWERFHSGAYAEAKRTAEAVLRLDPDSPELWQIRRLIRQCDDRLIQKEILEPTVEFRELVSTVEEEPRVLFRLLNHSQSALGVRAERGILGSLQVGFQRRFLDGSQRSDERTILIRTARGEEEVTLEPGTSYEREIPIRLEEPRPPRGMVLRIRVVGKFQPSRWGLEEKNLSRTLSLPPSECWVVARGEKPLAEVPLKKLESALFFRDLHSFFTGGQLAVWAAEDDPLLNEKLLRVLVESLNELDETGIRVADALLEESSGVKRDRKITALEGISDHWRRFWDKRCQLKSEARDAPRPLPRLLDR